ncbi:hypothetical protein [Hymenobacter sp. HSC-4F20]|nr:hypothetical protein [Hymenobacter sp. HSC-4F20]
MPLQTALFIDVHGRLCYRIYTANYEIRGFKEKSFLCRAIA